MAKIFDPEAGRKLYMAYCRQLRVNQQGYNVVSVTTSQGTPGPMPVDYTALSPRAKAIWQNIAQQFIEALPDERPRYF